MKSSTALVFLLALTSMLQVKGQEGPEEPLEEPPSSTTSAPHALALKSTKVPKGPRATSTSAPHARALKSTKVPKASTSTKVPYGRV